MKLTPFTIPIRRPRSKPLAVAIHRFDTLLLSWTAIASKLLEPLSDSKPLSGGPPNGALEELPSALRAAFNARLAIRDLTPRSRGLALHQSAPRIHCDTHLAAPAGEPGHYFQPPFCAPVGHPGRYRYAAAIRALDVAEVLLRATHDDNRSPFELEHAAARATAQWADTFEDTLRAVLSNR